MEKTTRPASPRLRPHPVDVFIVTGVLLIAAASVVLGVIRFVTDDVVPLTSKVYCAGRCS